MSELKTVHINTNQPPQIIAYTKILAVLLYINYDKISMREIIGLIYILINHGFHHPIFEQILDLNKTFKQAVVITRDSNIITRINSLPDYEYDASRRQAAAADEARRQAAADEARRRQAAADEAKRRQQAADEARIRQQAADDAKRQQAADVARRRQQAAEEARRTPVEGCPSAAYLLDELKRDCADRKYAARHGRNLDPALNPKCPVDAHEKDKECKMSLAKGYSQASEARTNVPSYDYEMEQRARYNAALREYNTLRSSQGLDIVDTLPQGYKY